MRNGSITEISFTRKHSRLFQQASSSSSSSDMMADRDGEESALHKVALASLNVQEGGGRKAAQNWKANEARLLG